MAIGYLGRTLRLVEKFCSHTPSQTLCGSSDLLKGASGLIVLIVHSVSLQFALHLLHGMTADG